RRKNNIGLTGDDLICKSLKRVHVGSAPAEVDAQVAALDPAELLQTIPKRRDPALNFRIILGVRDQRGEPPHVLLGECRERPRDPRAAEQRDELASFQLIELHSVPSSQVRIAGYRISSGQSAGISNVCASTGLEEPVRLCRQQVLSRVCDPTSIPRTELNCAY